MGSIRVQNKKITLRKHRKSLHTTCEIYRRGQNAHGFPQRQGKCYQVQMIARLIIGECAHGYMCFSGYLREFNTLAMACVCVRVSVWVNMAIV